MVKISLKQALKLKNQLVTNIQELTRLIHDNNSALAGNNRDYSVVELMAELDSKILELVKIKAAIQRTNAPIFEKIFMLSELKNKVQNFKLIPTSEGKQRVSYGNNEPEILTVELNQKRVRELIKGIENEIQTIQDDLDTFNAITYIEI